MGIGDVDAVPSIAREARAYRAFRLRVPRVCCLVTAVCLGWLLLPADCHALAAGRNWTPKDTTKVTGHTRLYPNRIDLDSQGQPLVFAALVGGIGYGTSALRWTDSSWVEVASLGYGVDPMHQVVSTELRNGLIWTTLDEIWLPGLYAQHYLVMSEFDGQGFAAPDTLGLVYAGWWKYAGAISGRRRWAVDRDYPGMRAWYSDTAHVWHHRQLPWGGDAGGLGMAIAPLNDTTAMVVFAGRRASLRWGLLQGDAWVEGDYVPWPAIYGAPVSPSLRRSPSGALWLGWSMEESYVQMATYRDGAWSFFGTLRCDEKPTPGDWDSKVLCLSRDDWELPVVFWTEHNLNGGFIGSVFVCVPSDSGYPQGEYVPGSYGGDYGGAVRDRNGDVWVVWETEDDGMFWTHSYTRATCSAPEARGRRRARGVSWRLSEPAPETWWAVERARDGEPFAQVARVRAGATTEMSWTDTDAERGRVRYRIRRECLDLRYEWWSEEGRWPEHSRMPLSVLLTKWLWQSAVAFEVEGAVAGPLEITLYDVAGRRVLRRSESVNETGRLSYRLDLGEADPPVGSGVYFLSVRDASGEQAEAAKIVVLR